MSTTLNIKRRARLFLYVVVFLCAISLMFVDSFRAEAEIVFFDALSIEQQVAHTDSEHQEKEYEYVWSAFTGVVPEGTSVEHITFTLAWIQSTSTETVSKQSTEDLIMDENIETPTQTDEPTEVIEDTTVEPGANSLVPENIPDDSSESTPEIHMGSPTVESTEVDRLPVIFEDHEPLPTVDTDIEHSVNDQASVTGFPLAHRSETYLFAQEDMFTETEEITPPMLDVPETLIPTVVNETIVPEAIVIPVLETNIVSNEITEGDDVVNETTYEVLTEVSTPTEVVSQGTSYIEETELGENATQTETVESANFAYSFDGTQWFPLGTVNLLTLSEVSFDVSQVSLDAIPSLRIRVRYHASSVIPEILFGKPQLALSYIPGVIEEPILQSDQEPNFLVSSVYADVVDGTTRAVLLERGGIFELWVYAIERESGLPLWTRLMSSGVASQGIPISVKERTVFWFDPQIRALYVFGVDRKSLTIVQPQSPQESALTFVISQSNKHWVVVFDTVSQTFTFTRTPNTSI